MHETVVSNMYHERMLTSKLLSAFPQIRHGITGRIIGFEPEEANIGISAPRDRSAAQKARQHWVNAAGLNSDSLMTVHQIHGKEVVSVPRAGMQQRNTAIGRGDAIISDRPDVAVMTLHADCLPIILADPEVPVVCVVHAGWRGTVEQVAVEAIRKMQNEYEAQSSRIVAFLGPGMKSCCYEVGDEVVTAWRASFGQGADQALTMGLQKLHLDLATANRMLLERHGIIPENIEDSGLCTSCASDRWFSHRALGPNTGRFGAIAGIVSLDEKEEHL